MKFDFAVIIPRANESEDFDRLVFSLKDVFDKIERGAAQKPVDNFELF